MQPSKHVLAVGALCMAPLLWALSFHGIKLAITAYHPVIVVFSRMFMASLLALALGKHMRQGRYEKGDWKLILGLVLCAPCLFAFFSTHALRYTSASQASIEPRASWAQVCSPARSASGVVPPLA